MATEIHSIQLACFNLSNRLFAVDIMRIREIILPQSLATLPGSSLILDGVINLRGSVIPVMNLRKRFGISSDTTPPAGRLLIVSLAGCQLALMVDDVREVITVPVAEIKPPAAALAGVGMEFVLGMCIVEEQVIMILNVDLLLEQDCHSDAPFGEIWQHNVAR
ncbi:MAG TPA: chemotaxis protein CheW [Desulfuromonadales bacterium]|nr:chemotaxis protein CheW [Desulfuromonadales bacterium]